jgi:hypothetical protein
MRKIALEKGYSLSEYGLKGKDNKIIDTGDIIKSEEDIFKFLKYFNIHDTNYYFNNHYLQYLLARNTCIYRECIQINQYSI